MNTVFFMLLKILYFLPATRFQPAFHTSRLFIYRFILGFEYTISTMMPASLSIYLPEDQMKLLSIAICPENAWLNLNYNVCFQALVTQKEEGRRSRMKKGEISKAFWHQHFRASIGCYKVKKVKCLFMGK